MQTILVPTDFSRNAYHALRYATALLKERDCTFFLLNVYENQKGFKNKTRGSADGQLSDKRKKASEAKLQVTIDRIEKENVNDNHSYELISEASDLNRTVQGLIKELNIDLIVLGNKGETSSIPLFLGSTTASAIQSVKKCPILTVPNDADLEVPKEMAFATDFKKELSPEVLNALKSMALLCGSAVRIVHIDEGTGLNHAQKANLDVLLDHLHPMAYSVNKIPNFISKAKIIEVFMKNSDIEVLAMVQNEHGELEKMLREPVIETMVTKINVPFFVVPEAS